MKHSHSKLNTFTNGNNVRAKREMHSHRKFMMNEVRKIRCKYLMLSWIREVFFFCIYYSCTPRWSDLVRSFIRTIIFLYFYIVCCVSFSSFWLSSKFNFIFMSTNSFFLAMCACDARVIISVGISLFIVFNRSFVHSFFHSMAHQSLACFHMLPTVGHTRTKSAQGNKKSIKWKSLNFIFGFDRTKSEPKNCVLLTLAFFTKSTKMYITFGWDSYRDSEPRRKKKRTTKNCVRTRTYQTKVNYVMLLLT